MIQYMYYEQRLREWYSTCTTNTDDSKQRDEQHNEGTPPRPLPSRFDYIETLFSEVPPGR